MTCKSLSTSVCEISFMFPDIDRETIECDLAVTQSSEATINRILDGEISAKTSKKFEVENVSSDEELPELFTKGNEQRTSLEEKNTFTSKNKFNFKKKSPQGTCLKLHDISLSESEPEDKESCELIQRIQKKQRITKPSTHDISDSSDNENGLSTLTIDRVDSLTKPKMTSETSSAFLSQQSNVTDSIENKDFSQSSNASISKGLGTKKKKRTAEEIEESKRQALILKEQSKKRTEERKMEQEQKKRALEFEKQRNRILKEAMKNAKPGECLKYITVVLSPGVVKEKAGSAILEALQKSDIKYDIQEQIHNNMVTFWREVIEVKELKEGNIKKLETVTREKVEDTILLLLPVLQFVTLVHNYKQKNHGLGSFEDLHDHIISIKNSLEGRDVTVIIQGLEKYFRDQKTRENRAYKKQVQSLDGEVVETKKRKKKIEDDVIITRLDVEEALVHLQLHDGCNIKFAELDCDIAKLVYSYTKAVAETPFKRDRLQTGFTFHLASSGSVHVDKEGTGLSKVWRQQLQQFQLVTAEVANAIIAVYPSPYSLYKAYQDCETAKHGERLLENIEVRRGAGVMATTRRVGKELSRRLFQLFTSNDPVFVLL